MVTIGPARFGEFLAGYHLVDEHLRRRAVRAQRPRTARHDTGPIVWGQPGTNGQHAFYQLLHQGTTPVPADVIGVARPHHDRGAHHDLLMANCFAQTEALAFGTTLDEVAAEGVAPAQRPHRVFAGNRPTSTLLLSGAVTVDAGAADRLLRAQGVHPGRDLADQLVRSVGVELGKVLADRIAGELAGGGTADHDTSTATLIERYRSLRR